MFEPNRLTWNRMRDAAFEARCYPGLDPAARSYPGPPCADHYQARETDEGFADRCGGARVAASWLGRRAVDVDEY